MDASAGERGVRLRVKGRRPFVCAMVTDSMGTGMFLPFTVLYFVHTAGLSSAAVGVALTVAGFAVLPARWPWRRASTGSRPGSWSRPAT
jgi:hypothetical protein